MDVRSCTETNHRPYALATLALLLAPLIHGQELLRIVEGRYDDKLYWVEPISDLDSDHVPDLLVVGRGSFPNESGVVFVQSGRTGGIIWGPQVPQIGFRSHRSRVIGDFNGDSVDDFASEYDSTSVGGSREVRIFSGVDGMMITSINIDWSDPGATTIGDPGDVNGDGLADVIVGGLGPRKDVHAGPGGHYLYSVNGFSDFAQSPRGIGDVDGDGKDDFAIGWWISDILTVHSGSNGAELYRICHPSCSAPFGGIGLGRWISPMGDVDGDGVGDFATSVAGAVHPVHSGVGVARIHSGVDGSVIRETWGPPTSDDYWPGFFGDYIGGGHDVNGDGVADFVASSDPPSNQVENAHSVVSGRTGAVVGHVRLDDVLAFETGWPQTLGDLNGDGYSEWSIADSSYAGINSSGRIWIFKGGPGDAETICLGTTNSAGRSATLTTFGPITPFTRELQLVVEGAVPDAFGHVVYGHEATPSPFGDGDLCIDPPSLRWYATCFTTDATGRAAVHADWGRPQISQGAGAWLPGTTWVLQAVYRDAAGGPAGFTTTSAVRVLFAQGP